MAMMRYTTDALHTKAMELFSRHGIYNFTSPHEAGISDTLGLKLSPSGTLHVGDAGPNDFVIVYPEEILIDDSLEFMEHVNPTLDYSNYHDLPDDEKARFLKARDAAIQAIIENSELLDDWYATEYDRLTSGISSAPNRFRLSQPRW